MVEAMISVALSSIIAYSIFAAMRAGDRQIQVSQLLMTVQDSAREGLYKMGQELRLSAPGQIVIGAGGNSVTFSIPGNGTPLGSDFAVNWDNSQQIQYVIGGLNNTQLVRNNLTNGQATVMANDVTAVNFAGDSLTPNVVTMTLSVQRAMMDGRNIPNVPLQITGQAEVRNT